MGLGDRIKIFMEFNGWEQADVARAANMDVKTVSAIVSRNSKRSDYLPALAAAFNVSIEDFLNGDPSTAPAMREPEAPYTAEQSQEDQLLLLFRQLGMNGRDTLLTLANRLHTHEHPAETSAANPFAKIEPKRLPSPAKKQKT